MSAELWTPPLDGSTQIEDFAARLGQATYADLYAASVTDLDTCWREIVACFELPYSGSASRALADATMPGTQILR